MNEYISEKLFFPVVKPSTMRLVLTIATMFSWKIHHQLDAKNVFLHGQLQDSVYVSQPRRVSSKTHLHHVCLLHKALYGLK